MNHLKMLTMLSMETKVVSRDLFWTSVQKNFNRMDSEKGNRVFARGGGGTMCPPPPPPWFLEPIKSRVGLTTTAMILFKALSNSGQTTFLCIVKARKTLSTRSLVQVLVLLCITHTTAEQTE